MRSPARRTFNYSVVMGRSQAGSESWFIRGRVKTEWTAGRTSSIRAVDDTSPPITTRAIFDRYAIVSPAETRKAMEAVSVAAR